MAQYSVASLRVSLIVADIPVGYTPPRGPAVEFRVTYNERQANEALPYSNLGRQWSPAWITYISDNTGITNADVKLITDNGGASTFKYNTNSQAFDVQQLSQARLVRISSTNYEVRFPDGAVEVYTLPDSTNGARRVFLTQKRDPAGNALTNTYDANFRLVAVTDAIGQ